VTQTVAQVAPSTGAGPGMFTFARAGSIYNTVPEISSIKRGIQLSRRARPGRQWYSQTSSCQVHSGYQAGLVHSEFRFGRCPGLGRRFARNSGGPNPWILLHGAQYPGFSQSRRRRIFATCHLHCRGETKCFLPSGRRPCCPLAPAGPLAWKWGRPVPTRALFHPRGGPQRGADFSWESRLCRDRRIDQVCV